jgi:hypothetical protein
MFPTMNVGNLLNEPEENAARLRLRTWAIIPDLGEQSPIWEKKK